MELRHPTTQERKDVASLVQAVVDEIYGGLWTSPPVPIGVTDWTAAWVAVDDAGLTGVALTSGEWIEDLWVAARARGLGTGLALLKHCEAEIRGRGTKTARLRVVGSNANAISFYKANGWTPGPEYQHESLLVTMLEMSKAL